MRVDVFLHQHALSVPPPGFSIHGDFIRQYRRGGIAVVARVVHSGAVHIGAVLGTAVAVLGAAVGLAAAVIKAQERYREVEDWRSKTSSNACTCP